MTRIYTAEWILPVSSAPINYGAVAVLNDRIVAVGERSSIVEQYPGAEVRNFSGCAILPGLINTHSHLELTAMRGFLEPEEGNFFAWLRKLTRARVKQMLEEDLYVSAAWGACEAARAGVTCLGNAGDSGFRTFEALRDVGLRGIVYQESFGPDPAGASANLAELEAKVSLMRSQETSLLKVGVSPHSPYTVSASQLELISEFALSNRLPVMIHAAESLMEELLLREGRGAFADALNTRGIVWRSPGVSTIRYLKQHHVLETKPVLAHCINIDEEDLEIIFESGASVAHCPKSNAKLGHGRAPFLRMVKRGIPVGLGSDSVASNNRCDILEEARFAVLLARSDTGDSSVADMLAWDGLNAATLGGARTLGLAGIVGELREGLQADLIAVSLTGTHQLPLYDPVNALIFSSSGQDVVLTVVAGREIFRDGVVTTVDEGKLRQHIEQLARKLESGEYN